MFEDGEDGWALWRPPLALGPQAIRDGVIEASINHEKGYVQSKEMIDIYSTREPQLAFHQRISFCLDIHNMSVKVSARGCRRRWQPQALYTGFLGEDWGGSGPSSQPVSVKSL